MQRVAVLLPTLVLSSFLQCNAANLHNLIYWTPHKTGSTSMRAWLRQVSSHNNITTAIGGIRYPYATPTDWHVRTAVNGTQVNCTIIGGHINVISIDERKDESELGRFVTTTRNVVDTYLSKYYHRTTTTFSDDVYRKSAERGDLFEYFRGVDPCEALRYYDGLPGCNLEPIALSRRVQRIVERIVCAVDTDDPQDDVNRLCEMMRLEQCATFMRKNSRGVDRYARMKDDKSLRSEIKRALKPARMLRRGLLGKKCANLKDSDSERWPHPGCGSS